MPNRKELTNLLEEYVKFLFGKRETSPVKFYASSIISGIYGKNPEKDGKDILFPEFGTFFWWAETGKKQWYEKKVEYFYVITLFVLSNLLSIISTRYSLFLNTKVTKDDIKNIIQWHKLLSGNQPSLSLYKDILSFINELVKELENSLETKEQETIKYISNLLQKFNKLPTLVIEDVGVIGIKDGKPYFFTFKKKEE